MTALLAIGLFCLCYWAVGEFTMWFGYRVYREPGKTEGSTFAKGGYSFWEGGYIWPILLPLLLWALLLAAREASANWPHGPSRKP